MCPLVKEERYPSYRNEGYDIAMVLSNTSEICVVLPNTSEICLWMYLCLCICIYSEVLISCFFLSGANCVCFVLCSFCIWSLWTLGTNSSTSSNPAPSVQHKMKVGAVDSIVDSHIFLSVFHTHSYSFLIISNQWDRHLLDVTMHVQSTAALDPPDKA